MSLFQLIFKQMRQRALSTWLTLFSVALGVALAIAIMILQRQGEELFGQKDYGYDVLVGAKGSPLQLTLNTVYHLDNSPGNIPYSLYESFLGSPEYRPLVKSAVPYSVGDSYQGHRIVATLPKLFGGSDDGQSVDPNSAFEYRKDQKYQLAQGRAFHPQKFEAVIGSDIPALTGLTLGSQFKATHGTPGENQAKDEHDQQWTIVGILQQTNTANDRVLFIPLTTFYTIEDHDLEELQKVRQGANASEAPAVPPLSAKEEHDHEHDHDAPAAATAAKEAAPELQESEEAHDAHEHHDESYTLNADGTIDLHVPKDQWLISAILVNTRGINAGFTAMNLQYLINNRDQAQAVIPAKVMREFFDTFLKGSAQILLLVATLVTIVAGVSILVSIYNSVSARKKEIAILRALGATRRRVLTLICLEAGLIGLLGGAIGFVLGHLLAAAGSVYLQKLIGERIDWLSVNSSEWLYLGIVIVISTLAGLVPALKAYRTPVATNLTAG